MQGCTIFLRNGTNSCNRSTIATSHSSKSHQVSSVMTFFVYIYVGYPCKLAIPHIPIVGLPTLLLSHQAPTPVTLLYASLTSPPHRYSRTPIPRLPHNAPYTKSYPLRSSRVLLQPGHHCTYCYRGWGGILPMPSTLRIPALSSRMKYGLGPGHGLLVNMAFASTCEYVKCGP